MTEPTPVMCSFAGCKRPGVHWEPLGRWWFCTKCYPAHLEMVREDCHKDCALCGVGFVTTNPRTVRCVDCRGKDVRPTHARRTA